MRGLYAIIDPSACRGEPFEIALAVLRGGCAALQLRDKLADDHAFLALAQKLFAACAPAGVPFFINDRVWLAAQVPGAGVHVGQGDESVERVRAQVGPARAIGVSTHSLEQAQAAVRNGADLLGFGPVFETSSKQDTEPVVGLSALQRVCASVPVPVVAIGGVNEANASAVAATGVSMAAAISALCRAASPEASARHLHALLRGTEAGTH